MQTDTDVELKFGSGHVVLLCYVTIDEIKSPGYDRGVQGSILSAVCFENLVLLHFFPLECRSFPNKYNDPTLHIHSSAFFATLSKPSRALVCNLYFVLRIQCNYTSAGTDLRKTISVTQFILKYTTQDLQT
jgi:hypothetical protein